MKYIKNIYSIQIFSVVSEHKSVTQSAQIMNISQSSVSYHIKKLEDDLSVVLFQRTANGLILTEDGALLAKHLERGLKEIQIGLEKIASRAGSVRVALLPMFASRWLSSRLGDLLEDNPTLQLSIQNHNNTYAKMENPEYFADLGIQWGRGNWNRFDMSKLWDEKLVVVCSPNYLKEYPIHSPEDIQKCTLLHVDDERMWEEWIDQNGLKHKPDQSQMVLEDRHFQLSSTINSLGVSLFAKWLVREELENGQLINPFNREYETSFAYHLIKPKKVELSRPAKEIYNWIILQDRKVVSQSLL